MIVIIIPERRLDELFDTCLSDIATDRQRLMYPTTEALGIVQRHVRQLRVRIREDGR